MKCVFLLSVLLMTASAGFAGKAERDSNYVRYFPKTITVRTYVSEKISIFTLEDNKTRERLAFRPNNILALGAGFTYRGISLNLSSRLPFHDYKEDKYGRTRRYDLQVHTYRTKIALDGYLQYYRGFHLNSLDQVSGVRGETTYPYFPEMTTLTVGMTGMYVFNGEKYSLRAAIKQQDRQIRSAGSFMLGGAIFTHFVRDDSSILPPYFNRPEFLGGASLQRLSNYSITANAGYGYTHVFGRAKNWFLSASGDVGLGPGLAVVRDVQGHRQRQLDLTLTANVRLGAGYNTDKWFTGFYFVAHGDRFQMPYEKSWIANNQGIFRVLVSRRLTDRWHHHKLRIRDRVLL